MIRLEEFEKINPHIIIAMENTFKPKGYNSVSPYFIVDGAERFIDLMK